MAEEKPGSVSCVKVQMTEEQKAFYANRSLAAFEILAEAAGYLMQMDVEILLTTVSIKVPGSEGRKLVVLANPSVPPDIVKEILVATGKDADFGVQQSQAVISMAIERAEKEAEHNCDECPDKEQCGQEPQKKETIH